MANLLRRALRPAPAAVEQRFGWDDYANLLGAFGFGGHSYGLGLTQTLPGQSEEKLEANFPALVQGALKRNGVIFACILTRMLVFSEARFQFRRLQNGRPGDLFGTKDLQLLERPWRGGTTGDLLTRMLLDADLAGQAYLTKQGVGSRRRVRRLRPDWVTIILGSENEPELGADALDADLLGYIYQPGGPTSTAKPVLLMPEEVAHFAPIPDPVASYRGMSWLQPIIPELQSDSAATTHKLKFFENGATPNMVVSIDPSVSVEAFKRFKEVMETEHRGLANAYKTLYLGGGADAKVVGSDLRQLDFKLTQGAGETRIAAAAGVPPVIVGLSEGLQSATYSNYGQARRRLADGTMRPLWRNAAGSLATLVPPPEGAELWYDDRDIPFLREDRKDAAEIQGTQATTIRQLVDAGFTPDSAIRAVESEDWALLAHTGLFSVQLRPPNPQQEQQPTKSDPIAPEDVPNPPDEGTGDPATGE
ncbi:phage portal protein [Pseudonocardia hispaniensis]|uniref:Phage portal protein n=1 Tax=Pseudonocardia hispaniensis TaxID=904933 RepID=A0ABW1J7S5_9PSEU